ncbi:MAG: sigma-70 family RNA polymerase sigma factor [Myxococcota bacterium]
MTHPTPPAEASDEDLLDRWIDGDAGAGKFLIRRHYRRILLFFYDKVGPEVSKDLTQATFETLCTNKISFRGDATMRTFLFGIARWKLVHHFRTVRAYGDRFEPMEQSASVAEVSQSIHSLFMDRQREALVVRALRSLPLDDQIVLELKEYEGMTARQIAAVYEVGRDTMSSRINRARKRLATVVAELAESAELVDSTLTGLDTCMREIRARIGQSAGEESS